MPKLYKLLPLSILRAYSRDSARLFIILFGLVVIPLIAHRFQTGQSNYSS
jgi:hypothetical protein